ncbi:MAG: NADH-quinone oxidoreductase subunit G [Actinomycetota bacterium]
MTDVATLTIDGKEISVPSGTLIIRAAEQLGIEIPRFCDHPYLEPAGSCRQCYVEVEGQRKLMTSCTTPVTPGMVVRTQNTSDQAHTAQVANLEFLLLNHPLDCPICDRGGECPLQDQALAFGPGESRYREAKRVYEKPLYLSPLVALDRERCVLCARCTRFCGEISGDRFIELFERGAAEQVAITPGEDFRSPFSGNTIQICPVGALTSVPYRFVARPFDLKSADSVCNHCSAGCNIRVDLRRGQVVRHLARDNPDVNDLWTCDKGRFAFQFPDSIDRLTTPLLREPGLTPVSFGEAFQAIARAARPGRVAFLAGGRLTDEDAYALSKLARVAFGTNDLDHRRGRPGDLPLAVEAHQAAGMRVTNADVEHAKVIVLVGLDAEQEVPILHLRIRKAATRHGAKVFVIHPRRTRLWDVAQHLIVRPGNEATELEWIYGVQGPRAAAQYYTDDIAEALRDAEGEAVVLVGDRTAESPLTVARAVAVATKYGAKLGFVARRAGDRGALRAGVHPALLPGGRRVEDEGELAEVQRAWGVSLPTQPGRDTQGILEAAAKREIDVLYLVGVDLLRDFPDAALARRALENVETKVVQDVVAGPLAPYADVVLPAAPWIERDGEHVSNWEGRAQRLHAVRGPAPLSRPDWQIFQELSEVVDHDLGFRTLEDLQRESAPLLGEREVDLAGVGSTAPGAALGEAGDGLLLFTYPLLVDEGTLSRQAVAMKEALGEPAFVEVHPDDAERIGLADGGTATVTTPAGSSAALPVRVTPNIALGTAFVPFNNPGLQANTLLSGRLTTTATLSPGAG